MPISSLQPVLRSLRERKAECIRELAKLVAIQSISTDGNHQQEIKRGAQLIRDQMRHAGLEHVQIIQIGKSNPYIYGDWLHAANSPTLFLYAHQDVQPADPADGWTTSPWKLTCRNGRLYGRGAADDKGAIIAQLAVVSAFLQTRGKIPVNIKMLVESEEEIGSPNLVRFFKNHHKLIQSDVIVVCDTKNLEKGLPSLTYSLRGIIQAQIEVESAHGPVHSGMGGGFIPDAALALNVLLARLYRGDGRPSIPAIESEVLSLTQQERTMLQQLPGNEQIWRKDFGVLSQVQFAHESRRHPYEQIWRRPSVTIIAQEASSIRGSSNQILPKAVAVLSCRTVPNQNSETVFRELYKLLTANPPWNVRVTVRNLGGVDWWMTNPDGPAFDAARKALRRGFGKEPTLIGGGGSIGFIKPLTDLLKGAPALLLGIEDPESHPHAPNESLYCGDLHKLIRSLVHLFGILG